MAISGPNGACDTVRVVNVYSPYTADGMHVMIMDWGGTYRPTPTEIPVLEMRGMMELASIVVDQMAEKDTLECISLGYNSSPLNFGAEEEQGGMQSVVTEHHFQIWQWSRKHAKTATFEELPENVRSYLQHDSLAVLGTRIMEHIVTQLHSRFINPKDISTDGQALRVGLTAGIRELLSQPMQFAKFIQTLHAQIEWANISLWEAFTTDSYRAIQAYIKSIYENPSYTPNMQWLRMPAELRPLPERTHNVAGLPPELFPDDVITRLQVLNGLLKNRTDVSAENIIRHGLGHNMVITQDLVNSDTAAMYLRAAGRLYQSRGGVVEAQRVSLHRVKESNAALDDAVNRNIMDTDRLVTVLPNSISYKSLRQAKGIRR